VLPGGHHHRCYRNKATENYLICGRRGVELVDLKNDNHANNWWIRGLCQYGVMPSNGLIYVPPDPCKCFNFIKVDGFLAVSAGNSLDRARTSGENRLQRGPAYSQATSGSKRRRQSDIIAAKSENTAWQAPLYYRKPDEWPTYRHDITRSGSAGVDVPTDLTKKWEVDIKGRLTAAVVADNKLFVSSVETQTLHCLDAGSGKSVWQFTARGQVDSPPTIYDGLALFGSRSGHVYCLDAATGRLAWRFRAAPVDSRIMTDGRLESVWPIHGSVLVLDGVVYFAAGRSSYTDGGISLFGLDVYSGEKLHAASLFARDSLPGEDSSDGMTGALPDVLVSDGEYINMRHVQFDRNLVQRDVAEIKTLLAPTGLLEDCWMHRINWALGYGDPIDSGAHAGVVRYTGTNSREPFGKLIVFDDKNAYGVQTYYTFLKHDPKMHPSNQDGHKHQKYSRYESEDFPIGVRMYARSTAGDSWVIDKPFQVRAMVLAGETIFAAGWVDEVRIDIKEGTPSANQKPPTAELRVMSVDDGKQLAKYKLDCEPVFDGMAAAYGRLYIPLKNGKIVCMGE
ncbi:MAG: PQQ-like beta-propeller repeat protein, partial [Planctomycetes bacterium]|nr:PQQ-like beta-propeller repeat protein [Planctomycetota bacterium]